jgi:hypothetical protein
MEHSPGRMILMPELPAFYEEQNVSPRVSPERFYLSRIFIRAAREA